MGSAPFPGTKGTLATGFHGLPRYIPCTPAISMLRTSFLLGGGGMGGAAPMSEVSDYLLVHYFTLHSRQANPSRSNDGAPSCSLRWSYFNLANDREVPRLHHQRQLGDGTLRVPRYSMSTQKKSLISRMTKIGLLSPILELAGIYYWPPNSSRTCFRKLQFAHKMIYSYTLTSIGPYFPCCRALKIFF